MLAKRILQSATILAVIALSLASAGMAMAGGSCGSFIIAQQGDTLTSIAAMCGTTVAALQAANPNLPVNLSPGQVVYFSGGSATPTGTTTPGAAVGSYLVRQGDTLGGIAMLFGISLSDLLAVNPQITDPSTVYAGQLINLPASANYSYYYPQITGTGTPFPTLVPSPTPTNIGGYTQPYGNLMITYGRGLLVRTGPGIENPEIKSPFVSAVKFSHWQYRKGSLTTDNIGFVWVEIKLSPLVIGHSSGWILVRDSLGMYFTSPQLGPKIIPGDP